MAIPKIGHWMWVGLKYRPRIERHIPPEEIAELVAQYLGYELEQLKVFTRKKEIVQGRFLAMFMIRKAMPRLSLRKIGQVFGNYDHATVLNALTKVQNFIDTEEDYKDMVRRVYELIYNELNIDIRK